MRRGRAIAALFAVALTSAAWAQSDDEDIVVSGQKAEEARREAIDYVRRIGVIANERQAARWVSKACPLVTGIAPNLAAIVEGRMRAIGAAAGVPLATAPCEPTIVVSFVEDGGAVARKVAARAPIRFAEVPAAQRERLFGDSAPIRWWYATRQRSPDGLGGGDAAGWTAGNGEGGGSVIPSGIGQSVSQQYRSSVVSTLGIRTIEAVTVVIDVRRAEGLPLTGVASYAAMVAFAEIAPDDAPPGSILAIAPGPDALRALPDRDAAFLRALYAIPLDRKALRQRGMLVRAMLSDRGKTDR